jgi:hypothetical protein
VKIEETPRLEAEVAVALYAEERRVLDSMRADFGEEYPDADEALNDIKQQEDSVHHTIATAKTKVGLAKLSVGDFTCTRSYSQAGYDDKKLTDTLNGMKSPGSLFEHLLNAGVIKEIKVDKAASAAFAAANPKLAKKLDDAWQSKTELTPRVTVPSI